MSRYQTPPVPPPFVRDPRPSDHSSNDELYAVKAALDQVGVTSDVASYRRGIGWEQRRSSRCPPTVPRRSLRLPHNTVREATDPRYGSGARRLRARADREVPRLHHRVFVRKTRRSPRLTPIHPSAQGVSANWVQGHHHPIILARLPY